MKILMVVGTYYPNEAGAEVFVRYLSEYLAKQGHKVDILTKDFANSPRVEIINDVRIFRISKFSLFKKYYEYNLFKRFYYEYEFVKQALALDKKNHYDIFHMHLVASKTLTGFFVKKFLKKPVVMTTQGGDLFDYDLKLWHPILKPFVKFAIRRFDGIHAVSNYCKSVVVSWGAKKAVVIPNCVDLANFSPPKSRKRVGIITTSRLAQKNGLHHVVQALAILKRKKNFDVKFNILGVGPWENKLKAMVKQYGLQDNVFFLGYIPNTKIKEYLVSSLVFVRPSLWEGFGVSFIEAMACKTPVVGTNVGGIPDIIDNGKNGILVEPGYVDALADAIYNLVNDKKLWDKFAVDGHKTVYEKFSCEKVLPKMEHWLLGIINESRNR